MQCQCVERLSWTLTREMGVWTRLRTKPAHAQSVPRLPPPRPLPSSPATLPASLAFNPGKIPVILTSSCKSVLRIQAPAVTTPSGSILSCHLPAYLLKSPSPELTSKARISICKRQKIFVSMKIFGDGVWNSLELTELIGRTRSGYVYERKKHKREKLEK